MTLIPDVEKILSAHLRDETGERIVGKTPENTDDAWVRLTKLDARAVGGDRHEHLIEAFVQLDCYASEAGGQPEANTLGRTIRASLVDAPNQSHEGATITGVEIRSDRRSPDPAFSPSRERIILTALAWMHS